MIITTYCSQASGADWSNISNLVGNSPSSLTTLGSSWSTGRLRAWGFDELSDAIKNPKSIITKLDVKVTLVANTTADATTLLKAGLSYNGIDLITPEKYIPAGYSELTTVTLSFTQDSSGRLLSRYNLRNDEFSVIITPVSGLNTSISISNLEVVATYFQDGNLLGETSTFPTAIDTIASETNSEDPFTEDEDFVIRSEELNKLGDAIIKVQRLASLDSNVLLGLGDGVLEIGVRNNSSDSLRKDVYCMTIYMSGSSIPEYFLDSYYAKLDRTTPLYLINATEFSSGRYTAGVYTTNLQPSALDANDDNSVQSLIADYVKGSGYIQVSGTKYPVHVTGYGVFYIDWPNSDPSYSGRLRGHLIGFRFLPVEPGSDFTITVGSSGSTQNNPSLTFNNGAKYVSTSDSWEIRLTTILVEQTVVDID